MSEKVTEMSRAKTVPGAQVIPEVLFILYFIGSLMVKCIYFQFTTGLNIRPFSTPFNLNMYKSTLGVVLIILSLAALIFNRRRKAALLVINLILSLLLFADTMYFRYYYNALTVPVLYQIGLVGSVSDSVISLLKPKDIVYIIDFPMVFAFFAIVKIFVKKLEVKINIVARLVAVLLIFLCGSLAFHSAYAKSSYDIFPYDNNHVINNLGIFYFHYYDVKRFIKDNYIADRKLTEADIQTIEEFFDNRPEGNANYRGIAEGKNVLIVQVEALQEFVINRSFNGRELTPNLNKYINESIYFENFYYQIGGGNTSDAEFLCNTSLYPVRDGAVFFRYATNTYTSLPKVLKENGYNTYVMHANNPSFWNRTTMYEALGFDTYFSSKDYELDEVLGWGLSDKSFFRQSLDKLDTSKPFYAFLVTLSSHHPYIYFENSDGFDVGGYEKTMLGNYLKAVHYVDEAIGMLIQELKDRGLYDDTILVIYGDHSAIQKDQLDSLVSLIGFEDNEFEWNKLQRVPCFIHFPGLDLKGSVDTVGGQIDILPTVLNLLGIEYRYAIGEDLFNTEKSYAVLRNGNVVAEDFVFITGAEKVYDIQGNILENNEYLENAKKLQKHLSVSELIVRKNALKSILK